MRFDQDYHDVRSAVIASSGNEAITALAAVAGKRIKVMSYVISVTGAQNVKWQSKVGSATAADLSGGLVALASTAPLFVAPHNPNGYFTTASGGALLLLSSAAGAVGGHFTYLLVD